VLEREGNLEGAGPPTLLGRLKRVLPERYAEVGRRNAVCDQRRKDRLRVAKFERAYRRHGHVTRTERNVKVTDLRRPCNLGRSVYDERFASAEVDVSLVERKRLGSGGRYDVDDALKDGYRFARRLQGLGDIGGVRRAAARKCRENEDR